MLQYHYATMSRKQVLIRGCRLASFDQHPGGSIMSDIDRLKTDIDEIVPGMVALRRDLHEHPELAFEEVRTAGIVAGRLRALGLEVQTGIAQTGVVGTLKGGKARPG